MVRVDISEIRAVILRLNPFWGYILLQTPIRVEKDVWSSYTDGKEIVLKEGQVQDKRMAVQILLHELVHIAYMHVARRKDEYEKILGEKVPEIVANLGEDVVANAIVYDITGRHIPSAAVLVEGMKATEAVIRLQGGQVRVKFGERIEEMTTEEIIRKIWDVLRDMVDVRTVGWGDDHSKHGGLSDAEKDILRHKIEKAVREAERMRGEIPAGLEELIEAMKPRVRLDWRKFMKKWFYETVGMDDFSWKRPNRRMAATGLYLPRTVGLSGEVFVVMDTSGSMDERLLGEALGTIVASALGSGIRYVWVVQVDADVQKVERIPVERLRRYRMKGRGGTVLKPGIEEAVKRGAKAVVVITDGYVDDEEFEDVRVPTLIVSLEKEVKVENPLVRSVKAGR